MESRNSLLDASMECGCLRLYRVFVSGILPTEREERAIRKHVEALCDRIMGAGSICVLKDGVREGVLFEKLARITERSKR